MLMILNKSRISINGNLTIQVKSEEKNCQKKANFRLYDS